MRVLLAMFAVAVLVSVLPGCRLELNKKEKKEETSQQDENASPLDAMQKAFEGISNGNSEDVKTVDHRKLKELLEEKVRGGYERTDYSSESVGAFGFNISNAEAEYSGPDDRSIKVTIADTGGFGAALMGLAAWSSMQVDKENSNGWERTGNYDGYKSYETYRKDDNYSELALIVENRFIVSLEGTNCSMDDLKDFADRLDIDDLKSLI